MSEGSGLESFEPFDPAREPGDAGGEETPGEFEEYDVMAEPEAEQDLPLEALGALSESEYELQSLQGARAEAERRLMAPPGEVPTAIAEDGPAGVGNVVGVGIAEKTTGGIPTGRLSVTVFVKEKLSHRRVSQEALVPETIGGVQSDVEGVGEISAHMFTGRFRPAPGGVSIGHCGVAHAGTLACLVTRSNQLFVLSNNHVMASVNTSPLNAQIPQPGRLDGGVCPGDVIARLTQFIPITFSGSCNFVDASIARTSPSLVDRRILRPFGARQALAAPVSTPALNQQVQKSGRTTQYRRGLIDAVSVTADVSYAPLGGIARFCGQFRVRGTRGPFSDRGDSGSLVTTLPENRPVGLLFAGNAVSDVTFCNPISRVLSSLGVSIVF